MLAQLCYQGLKRKQGSPGEDEVNENFFFPRYLNNWRFHCQHMQPVKPQEQLIICPVVFKAVNTQHRRGTTTALAQQRVWQHKASLRSAQEQRQSCHEQDTEDLISHIP